MKAAFVELLSTKEAYNETVFHRCDGEVLRRARNFSSADTWLHAILIGAVASSTVWSSRFLDRKDGVLNGSHRQMMSLGASGTMYGSESALAIRKAGIGNIDLVIKERDMRAFAVGSFGEAPPTVEIHLIFSCLWKYM
jgi:hypothetical protein